MLLIYDIEVLSNYFLYLSRDVNTGEEYTFEISVIRDELPELLEHLDKVKGQIGFNNISYDSQVIQEIVENQNELLSIDSSEKLKLIYKFSQDAIYRSNNKEWPKYPEWKIKIPQLDLLRVWHYDNEGRRCSLKWLQYSMDWWNIEDMPLSHNDKVEDEETINEIRSYCRNDVESTFEFYKITKGNTDHPLYNDIDKIRLRKDIKSEFGINCINFSDVKIGDEINKVNYINSTGKTWKEITNTKNYMYNRRFTFGECIPDYIKFESEELKSFVKRIENIYIDLKSKEQKFKFIFKTNEYTFAKGGLHSNDKSRVVKPLSNQILRDADVGSMYPNAIRKRRLYPKHLGEPWLNGYSETIKKRLDAKKKFKETKDKKYKSVEESFKYCLNGGSFGKTNEPYNWQYDPFVTFCVTIGCQLELMMLIEMLELNGIRVVSANTDGILSLIDKDKEQIYNELCTKWEKIVGNNDIGKLEFVDYQVFSQTSVNDYIAVKKDGEIKQKGDFVTDFELHKNKSYRIIPLALNEYYSKGINPRFFILEHKNIFDFCRGVRANKGWYFELISTKGGILKTERLRKTNRYYISNNGKKLIKCNTDGRKIQPDAGKWECTLYNKHEERESFESYDINYNFYVEKIYEIIKRIEPEVVSPDYKQLSLF